MKTDIAVVALTLFLSSTPSLCGPTGYPHASLDHATTEIVNGLQIERLVGFDDEELDAEYEWTRTMAGLCLAAPDLIRDGYSPAWGIEFQRHAGRVARYRGLGEDALRDYELAIDYLHALAPHITNPKVNPITKGSVDVLHWEETILRDIADTYAMLGVYKQAAAISTEVSRRLQVRGEIPPQGSPHALNILARKAEVEGRFPEAVSLQRRAVLAVEHSRVEEYLSRHPELARLGADQSWDIVVRAAVTEGSLAALDEQDLGCTTSLREVYIRLARAMRINSQFDDAGAALETAELTPWRPVGPYRQDLNFYVDRERAFLWLAQGKPAEALEKAEECLVKYSANMHPSEKVELLDLVSQAMEQLGDEEGALEKVEEAIGIVEEKRANLTTDEFKQSFSAGYAPLYRRALELSIQLDEGKDKQGEKSFEWSERVKGRAMLDAVNRYDKMMARAIAASDTDKMRSVREQTAKVVSLDTLRKSAWLRDDTAILAFAYGEASKHCSQSPGMPGPYGSGTHAPKSEGGPVYAWLISKKYASFPRLPASAAEIDNLCKQLMAALPQQDDGWVAPATRLYALTIAPVADQLQGIKRLVIVADGALRTVPFEVFVTGASTRDEGGLKHKLLIEDYAISYAPSVTLLDAINERPRPADWQHTLWAFASTRFGYEAPRAVARAAPVHADQATGVSEAQEAPSMTVRDILRSASTLNLPDLRNTRREIEDAAQAARPSKARTWIDTPNMKDVILAANGSAELKSVRLLHFATHAFVDEDRPHLCGLMLCPPYPEEMSKSQNVKTSPSNDESFKTAGAEGDIIEFPTSEDVGHPFSRPASRLWRETLKRASDRPERLTLHEIAALDLQSDLVILSACRSIGRQRMDGDWLSGLARAFLIAGSSGVIGTLWETGDRLSADFMPAFYNELLSGSTSQALDAPAALQKLKTSLLASPNLCHPANWAAFVYIGRI